MKNILVNIDSGLNDCIGGLCYIIDFCFRMNIPYENIDFYAKNYTDIIKVIDFHRIAFIQSENKEKKYDLIYSKLDGADTNRGFSTSSMHISDFIKIKPEYSNYFLDNKNKIGVHFRFYDSEYQSRLNPNQQFLDKELEDYTAEFNSIYDESEQYILYSDHPMVRKIKSAYNIEIVCPEVAINVNNVRDNRKKYAIDSILSIYSMSKCKRLYKTKGNFTSLCKIFDKKSILEIKK